MEHNLKETYKLYVYIYIYICVYFFIYVYECVCKKLIAHDVYLTVFTFFGQVAGKSCFSQCRRHWCRC